MDQLLSRAEAVDGTTPAAPTAPGEPSAVKSTLTLWQANLLVAMLGGFWARQADGHPGPDLLGRGLLMLTALVRWERIRKENDRKTPPAKEPRRKPG
jgi:hypothetical protein